MPWPTFLICQGFCTLSEQQFKEESVLKAFHSISAHRSLLSREPGAFLTLNNRVSLKTQNVSQRAPNGGYAVSICGGPLKKISDFYLNFWPDAQHICGGVRFCLVVMGKELLADLKTCNFQKLAWYSPENGNAWTKCLPHHFGGVFHGGFGVRS